MMRVYASCSFLWAAILPLSPIQAQKTLEAVIASPVKTVEDIPKGVTEIEVDQEGNLYLLSPGKHRITKFLKSTDFDSSLSIGGKGIGDEGFNFPTKIAVRNRQSVFVLDQMNRRLVQLNTNLKVIEDVSFLTIDLEAGGEEVETLWPISFVVGPTGELYLLNQDDLRIYKLSAGGEFQRAFGGLDYGQGSVNEPWDLAMNGSNLLFAIDSAYQELHIYDLFGTYQYRLAPNLPFRWHHALPLGSGILLLGRTQAFYYDLSTKQGNSARFEGQGPALDIAADRDFLYVLFENRVILYAF